MCITINNTSNCSTESARVRTLYVLTGFAFRLSGRNIINFYSFVICQKRHSNSLRFFMATAIK